MDSFKFSDLVQQDKEHGVRNIEKYLAVISACINAMEGGLLPVTAQQNGLFLRDGYILPPDKLARLCVLLQQHRLPASLLWKPKMGALFYFGGLDVAKAKDLADIEFLWQDLEAVEAWIDDRTKGIITTGAFDWVTAEVDRRRQWSVGLRRAWLVAAV